MVQRLIFKSTKFFEILLMLIRFNKICMGSVFFFWRPCTSVVPIQSTAIEIERGQYFDGKLTV